MKMWKKMLNCFANFVLVLATVSITQCSCGIIYQIPVDDKLKQKIIASKENKL